MPALSKKQQQFMALVLQYKRGELSKDEVSPEVVKAAKSMSAKDVEDFASTKHDGLPDKKTDERLDSFRKLIRKEVMQNLKDGTYNRDVLKNLLESGRPLNERRVKINRPSGWGSNGIKYAGRKNNSWYFVDNNGTKHSYDSPDELRKALIDLGNYPEKATDVVIKKLS